VQTWNLFHCQAEALSPNLGHVDVSLSSTRYSVQKYTSDFTFLEDLDNGVLTNVR
jgi:hypothetical protein